MKNPVFRMHFLKCEFEIVFDFIVNTGFYFLWSLNVVMYFRRCILFGKISFLWNPCNASCYALCRKLMWNFTGNHFWMIIKPCVSLCDWIQILLQYIQIQIQILLQYIITIFARATLLKAGFSDHNLGYWHQNWHQKLAPKSAEFVCPKQDFIIWTKRI